MSRELLREVTALAQFAPTWKNSQTVRYIIVDDPALKDRIADEAVLGYQKNMDNIKSAAAAVIVSSVKGIAGYNEDGSPSTTKGSHWESLDAGIAVQTFCLAAHECGLGTVIMGMFDADKLAEVVQLPDDQSVACLLAIGYPGEGPHGKAVRKPLDEVLTFK